MTRPRMVSRPRAARYGFWRGFWRDNRATAAIEMGLIALPLVMLLLGLVEFGRGLHIKNAMNEAADRGQRMLMIDPAATENAIATAIRAEFRAGDSEQLTVAVVPTDVGGTTYQRITLGYPMRLLIPSPVGRTITISAEQLTFTR